MGVVIIPAQIGLNLVVQQGGGATGDGPTNLFRSLAPENGTSRP